MEQTEITADVIAYLVVPEGPLPEDHPDHMTDNDPWSRVWDAVDAALHREVQS